MKLDHDRLKVAGGIFATLILLSIAFSIIETGQIVITVRDVVLAIITGVVWYALWPRIGPNRGR